MTEKNQQNRSVEKTVRDIRRVTRRQYSAGIRSATCWKVFEVKTEGSIAELCRREGIHIHVEVKREDKGALVRESRRINIKMIDWVVKTLNAAIKKLYDNAIISLRIE